MLCSLPQSLRALNVLDNYVVAIAPASQDRMSSGLVENVLDRI